MTIDFSNGITREQIEANMTAASNAIEVQESNERFNMNEAGFTRLQNIFDRLKVFLPKSYQEITMVVSAATAPNYKIYQGGFAVPHAICVGTQYLNRYTSDIALAEMLAHELGHHVLGHVNLNGSIHKLGEHDADHFGMFLCELAGFTRKEYIEHFDAFEKGPFRNHVLSQKHVDEHGTGNERIDKLKKHDIYLEDMENL